MRLVFVSFFGWLLLTTAVSASECKNKNFAGSYVRQLSWLPEGQELQCALNKLHKEKRNEAKEERQAIKGKGLICSDDSFKDNFTLEFKGKKFPFETFAKQILIYFKQDGMLFYREYQDKVFISSARPVNEAELITNRGYHVAPFYITGENIQASFGIYYFDGKNPIWLPFKQIASYKYGTDVNLFPFEGEEKGYYSGKGWSFPEGSRQSIYIARDSLILTSHRGQDRDIIPCKLLTGKSFEEANKIFELKIAEEQQKLVPQARQAIEGFNKAYKAALKKNKI